jgi:hypothetical protein
MDMNYLLHRHQISLARSSNAKSSEARNAHAGLTKLYATKIKALRASMFPDGHVLPNFTQSPLAVSNG